MKRLKLTMEFTVPDKLIASGFSKLLRDRMHKYLAKNAVTVYKMDTVITDAK